MLHLLAHNATVLSIIGASIAFAWSIIRFVLDRRKELQDREFEAYHRLIKELVSPDPESKVMWIDRQAAVVFELRHFPRYYEFTVRMLLHLREKWKADPDFQWQYLLDEVDRTIEYVKSKKK